MKTAVVILFHGSRVEGSNETSGRIVASVQRQGQFDIVTAAYLQYGSPGLDEAVQACVHQAATRVVIVPFFLQTGTHVTADIPARVGEARKNNPHVAISVTDAVGSHPLMTNVILALIEADGRKNEKM